jgi:carbohydrate-binding DOMON domain-containing protein
MPNASTARWLLAAALLASATARAADPAGTVVLTDPTGDDDGPGTYTYPTDAVYEPGSFDLTEL